MASTWQARDGERLNIQRTLSGTRARGKPTTNVVPFTHQEGHPWRVPQNNLLLRRGVLGQLLSTTEDGEHENVIVTNTVYDSITSQEHLSDVVTMDLRDDARSQGHLSCALRRFSQIGDPLARRLWVVPRDVSGDLFQVSHRASRPPNRAALSFGHRFGTGGHSASMAAIRLSAIAKGVDLIFTMVSTTYRHTIAGM